MAYVRVEVAIDSRIIHFEQDLLFDRPDIVGPALDDVVLRTKLAAGLPVQVVINR